MITASVDSHYHMTIDHFTATHTQFVSLLLIEYAGIRPPDAVITYRTTDDKERSKQAPDTQVNVTIARSIDDIAQPLVMYIIDSSEIKEASGEYVITTTLSASPPSFRAQTKIDYYDGSSTGAMQYIARAVGYNVDSRAAQTDDIMTWLRTGTAREFMLNAWRHSYIPRSTVLCAFNIDSTFRIYDSRTVAASAPAFILKHNKPTASNELQVIDVTAAKSRAGMLSHTLAAGRSRQEYDMSTGLTKNITGDIARATFAASRYTTTTQHAASDLPPVRTDNQHRNYTQALLNNKANLARLSTVSYMAMTKGTYTNAHPLDIVQLHEDAGAIARDIPETGSGTYIIHRVVREVTPSAMETTLLLNRESHNAF